MWTLSYTEQLGYPGFAVVSRQVTFNKVRKKDISLAARLALEHISRPGFSASDFVLHWGPGHQGTSITEFSKALESLSLEMV